MATMTATSFTPPSSPRKSSFSSLRLSPIKSLSFMKKRIENDSDALNPALDGGSTAAELSALPVESNGIEERDGRIKLEAKARPESMRIKGEGSAEVLERERMKDIEAKKPKTQLSSEGCEILSEAQAEQKVREEDPTPAPRRILRFAHVADLFIKLKRAQRRAALSALNFQRNALVVESTSGDEPVTHSGLVALITKGHEGQEAKTNMALELGSSHSAKDPVTALKRRARVELCDTFVCTNGVDASKLLRATRALLHERAESLFGVCLFVEESWTCSVYAHKHRQEWGFQVQVRYSATTASPVTASHHLQSTRTSGDLSTLSSQFEIALNAAHDQSPRNSPPASPSRKGKKRLSFPKDKLASKTETSETDFGTEAPCSSQHPTVSAATRLSPPSSPNKERGKHRMVSFAQPSGFIKAIVTSSDLHQPVSLQRARGVPGLMTIVCRETTDFLVSPVH